MSSKRCYGESCAAAHALDLVGERWALLVVRELVFGPKRFTDLRTGIPHASPNVLSQRLRALEEAGIVRRRTLPPPAASRVYELTDWGAELEPVITQLGRWGARSPLRPRDAGMSVDALMLALRTMFDPEEAAGFAGTIHLRLADDSFVARIAGDRLDLVRSDAGGEADAAIETDPLTLVGVVFEGRPLSEALRSNELTIKGDKRLARGFLGLFRLPEVVPPPDAATVARVA